MKMTREQELQKWREAILKAQKAPRSLIWGIRVVLLLLFFVWLGGALYLHSVVKQDERDLEALRQKKQQKEELLRREAAYRQAVLQQTNPQSRVKNAIDGVKK